MGLFQKKEEKALPQRIKVPALPDCGEPDGSIPVLSGADSAELLTNPNRGLRMEVYYTLGSGHGWPGDQEDGMEFLKKRIAFYKEDKPQAIQVYFYLCEYNKKELDDTAFRQMKEYLTYIRDCGLSMELRYAYEYDSVKPKGPKNKMLLRHVEQLKDWMARERALIHDTVITLQFGMIGAWGEVHSSQHRHDLKRTFSAVCGMVPSGTYLQARTMEHKIAVEGVPNANMVGYHNDFMIGRAHEWNTAGAYQDSQWYRLFERTVADTVNDGEMPWGRDTTQPVIDGVALAQQCFEHHLTTLSMAHNYKEYRLNRSENGNGPYNMERWQSEELTPEDCAAAGLPCYPQWFELEDGTLAKRTRFDYIRDFLGYHLVLSSLQTGEDGSVRLDITNYGFAAPFQLEFARLAVRDASGGWQETELEGFCPQELKTCVRQTLRAAVPGGVSGREWGIRLGRTLQTTGGARYVKTANQIPFTDGVNVLGQK